MSAERLTAALTGQALIKRALSSVDERLRCLLRGHSCAFTGFEGTVAGSGWPTKDRFVHAAEAAALDTLAGFGIDLLALANNHAFDLGPEGVLRTLAEARARGLAVAGAGADLTVARAPAFLATRHGRIALVAMDASGLPDCAYALDAGERIGARPGVNPLRIRRGVRLPNELYERMLAVSEETGHEARKSARRAVGYPQADDGEGLEFHGLMLYPGERAEEWFVPDPADLAANLAAVADAARAADAVIAYVHQHHWAPSWQDAPVWLRDVGRACVDAGASAFVSHGVPMLLGVEFHRGRPLAYGLGNFVFHTDRRERYADAAWESVVLGCDFTRGDVVAHALEIPGPSRDAPRLASGERADAILTRFAALCAPLGTRVDVATGGLTEAR